MKCEKVKEEMRRINQYYLLAPPHFLNSIALIIKNKNSGWIYPREFFNEKKKCS